jgi:hypothetical protein
MLGGWNSFKYQNIEKWWLWSKWWLLCGAPSLEAVRGAKARIVRAEGTLRLMAIGWDMAGEAEESLAPSALPQFTTTVPTWVPAEHFRSLNQLWSGPVEL